LFAPGIDEGMRAHIDDVMGPLADARGSATWGSRSGTGTRRERAPTVNKHLPFVRNSA
jgi:hypothetical protein